MPMCRSVSYTKIQALQFKIMPLFTRENLHKWPIVECPICVVLHEDIETLPRIMIERDKDLMDKYSQLAILKDRNRYCRTKS